MDWNGARHLGDVTEIIRDWKKTSLVCAVNITDVIPPSDAEYLTLTFHVEVSWRLQHTQSMSLLSTLTDCNNNRQFCPANNGCSVTPTP